MKLSDWAPQTRDQSSAAWRWFKAGKLPVAARQLPTGTILSPEGRTALYARVWSADTKDGRQRQVQRLQGYAHE